jgi:hypothetical protein
MSREINANKSTKSPYPNQAKAGRKISSAGEHSGYQARAWVTREVDPPEPEALRPVIEFACILE